MKTQGAFTIIINEDNKVLLAKRRDFPIWDLPGGRMDAGESPEVCAVREAEEETGYKIEILKKIGEYDRPEYQDVQHVFLGRIVGGQGIEQGDETRALKFYPTSWLPCLMVPHRKRQIKDYKQGKTNYQAVLNDKKVVLNLLKQLQHKVRR